MFADRATGLVASVAIHSTALGPAAGGLRLARYGDLDAAAADALALARAMTLKNAAAGLDVGGGKAVLIDDGKWSAESVRTSRLRAFGARLAGLDGRYITAEDVGTTPLDMHTINEVTPYVTGLPGASGDPSAATARTVFAAIKHAVELELGSDLAGFQVGVLGTGNVGARLVSLLRPTGSTVLVADLNEARADTVAEAYGAVTVPVSEFARRPMEVFAPCAMGGVIGPADVPDLTCRIVAGAANNPLSDGRSAALLHSRGVLYVPDFLANNGGIIHVASDILDFDAAEVDRRIEAAIERTHSVLLDARAADRPPLELALELAERRLAAVAGTRAAALTR